MSLTKAEQRKIFQAVEAAFDADTAENLVERLDKALSAEMSPDSRVLESMVSEIRGLKMLGFGVIVLALLINGALVGIAASGQYGGFGFSMMPTQARGSGDRVESKPEPVPFTFSAEPSGMEPEFFMRDAGPLDPVHVVPISLPEDEDTASM